MPRYLILQSTMQRFAHRIPVVLLSEQPMGDDQRRQITALLFPIFFIRELHGLVAYKVTQSQHSHPMFVIDFTRPFLVATPPP